MPNGIQQQASIRARIKFAALWAERFLQLANALQAQGAPLNASGARHAAEIAAEVAFEQAQVLRGA